MDLRSVDCLVLDASTRQALVVTRALGRAGLTVNLAESSDECDRRFAVPAFSSAYTASNAVLPSIREVSDNYAAAVIDLIDRRPTRVVVPVSDGSIAALRPWRGRIEERTALALASESALDVANDKTHTLALADRLGVGIPRLVPIEDPGQVAAALTKVGVPAVIKPNQSWVWSGNVGSRVLPNAVMDVAEAVAVCDKIFGAGCPSALVQEYVPGRREALCVFYARGRVWAEFALVAHRMTPILGGLAVIRESIPVPEDLRGAVRILEEADVEGFSEIEFRRDASGRPVLMEINARLSGSLELPVRAGIDFPRYLWDWAVGAPLEPSGGYRTGVRLRYLYGDTQWLLENIRRHGRPDSVGAARAVGMFSMEFLRRNNYDYVDRDDPRPALVAIGRSVVGFARRVRVRLKMAIGARRGASV